jgi:hypothetical protein
VDGGQRRVGGLVERGPFGVFVVVGRGRVRGVARRALRLLALGEPDERVLGRRERAGEHLDLLVRLVEAQREGVAPPVPLPAAVGDEARAALEALAVVGHDARGLPARDEPPDDDRLARLLGVAGRDLEDEERRRLRPAVLPHLEAAGDAHVELERGLEAVVQVLDAREVRTVLVAHRQVVEEVFDRRLGRVALARSARQRQRQLARRLRPEPRDAALGERKDGDVEREGRHGEVRNDECGMMNQSSAISCQVFAFN